MKEREILIQKRETERDYLIKGSLVIFSCGDPGELQLVKWGHKSCAKHVLTCIPFSVKINPKTDGRGYIVAKVSN